MRCRQATSAPGLRLAPPSSAPRSEPAPARPTRLTDVQDEQHVPAMRESLQRLRELVRRKADKRELELRVRQLRSGSAGKDQAAGLLSPAVRPVVAAAEIHPRRERGGGASAEEEAAVAAEVAAAAEEAGLLDSLQRCARPTWAGALEYSRSALRVLTGAAQDCSWPISKRPALASPRTGWVGFPAQCCKRDFRLGRLCRGWLAGWLGRDASGMARGHARVLADWTAGSWSARYIRYRNRHI